MAADACLLRVLAQYYDKGVNTSPPLVNHAPTDYVPTAPAQGMGPRRLIATTAGVTLHLDGWNAVWFMVVTNNDSSNLVEATWHYLTQAAVDTTNVQPIKPGASIVINGPVTLASNIVFKSVNANASIDVSIIGT